MEYCSLNDAFPATGPPPVGCRGGDSTSAALTSEKKKSKRCKAPRLTFVDSNLDEAAAGGAAPPPDSDPDRPSVGARTEPPKAFKNAAGTGVQEAYAGIQPVIEPVGPSTENSATTRATPSWFGRHVDEGFTPYTGGGAVDTAITTGGPGDPTPNAGEYMLTPSFEKSFSGMGVDKSNGGPVLPLPNLSDRWKPMTPGGDTAFFERVQGGPRVGTQGVETMTDAQEIKKKLDRIFARLDDMEARRACTDNNNTEVGMFVMSGLFVLFFMDLLVRKTSTSLRVFSA
jgi:hypothetical protein